MALQEWMNNMTNNANGKAVQNKLCGLSQGFLQKVHKNTNLKTKKHGNVFFKKVENQLERVFMLAR